MRAAAAITSMTMKGGTSLRAEGVIRRRARSSIMEVCSRLSVAAFGRFSCGCGVAFARIDPLEPAA
jgi:hypothetical protein